MQTQGGSGSGSKRSLASFVAVGVAIIIVVAAWSSLVFAMGTTNPVMIVEGNSMHDYLEDGYLVFVKSVSAQEIEEADIIIFYSHYYDKSIIHRVKEIVYNDKGDLTGFVTKGDNNMVADPGIALPENVNGKVVGFIPYLGSFLKFLKSQIGITLMAIIIVFLFVWSLMDGRKEQPKAEAPAPQTNSLCPLNL